MERVPGRQRRPTRLAEALSQASPSQSRPIAAAKALEHAFKFLLEAGQPATAVDQVAVAAGPGRMGFGVDVEGKGVAFLAIGGVGLKLGAVRHRNLDPMIVRVKIVLLFHDPPRAARRGHANESGALYRNGCLTTSGRRGATGLATGRAFVTVPHQCAGRSRK